MPPSATDQQQAERTRSKQVKRRDIAEIVSDVFTTMLDLPITVGKSDVRCADGLRASVRVTGHWNAGIRVATPIKLATRIAGTTVVSEKLNKNRSLIRESL